MSFSKIYRTIGLLITLCIFPLHIHAESSEFYTIQTGSFTTLESAEEEFDAIMLGLTGLNGMTLGYLRIEKIGDFYAVRVGKFMDYISAEEFLQATRSQLSGAIILKAHIKRERIIRRFDKEPAVKDIKERPLPPAETEIKVDTTMQQKTEPVKIEVTEPVKEDVKKEEDTEETKPVDQGGFIDKIRGRTYVSDYFSTDSGDYNFHVITGRLNIYKREEDESGLYFEFDGKVRKKIIDGDLGAKVSRFDINEAWAGYKFPGRKLRVIAGRQYIQELYSTDIDGLNVKYSFKKGLGIGLFGGLAPDKFDDSLNDDYQSAGLYGFLNRQYHKISLGYEHLAYKGSTDREYFSMRAYSRISEKIRINGLTSVSKNQLTDNFEMENANANLTYSHSRKLRFSLFGNYYRTIKYYESSKFYFAFSDTDENYLLDTNSQTRGGVRIDYKLAKGLKVYGAATYQHRKRDDEDSTRFTGGIRKYDLYGFDLSGRYTYIDNYSSRDHEYNVEIYRHIFSKMDVSVYASYEETKLDLENAYTSGSRTYGASLYLPFTKNIYMTMFIEYLDEEDYSSTSLFTQLGYKLNP